MSEPTAGRKTTKRQSRLRFEMLNFFIDEGIGKAGLTACEALIWMVLYRDVRPNGFATTSVDEIARRAGIGRRTVASGFGTTQAVEDAPHRQAGRAESGASSYAVFPVPME